MNTDFASYVREASFSLTLSAEMIEGILHIERGDADNHGYGTLYSRRTSNALYRRGMIIPTSKPVPEAWRTSELWPFCYELTEVGKLTAGLLREAGFKAFEIPPSGPSEEFAPEVTVTLKQPAQ